MFPKKPVSKVRTKKDGCVPDVPSKVLAPGKDHATFPITTTLKGLCWGLTITFKRGLLLLFAVNDDKGRFRGHIVHDRTRGKKQMGSNGVPDLFKNEKIKNKHPNTNNVTTIWPSPCLGFFSLRHQKSDGSFTHLTAFPSHVCSI
jgi:hypothetical protein